jgi:hypothetical protein
MSRLIQVVICTFLKRLSSGVLESLKSREGSFDRYRAERTAVRDAFMLLEYETFVVYDPGLFVPHYEKQGI